MDKVQEMILGDETGKVQTLISCEFNYDIELQDTSDYGANKFEISTKANDSNNGCLLDTDLYD